MKGIVFNLLEEIVSEEHGPETWDALLDATESNGSYTSLGNYPDAELLALVGAASTALDTPADDLVRWFGRNAIPKFYERYPQLFDPHHTTSEFVVTLNDIIHPEVKKLYPGADPPEFDYHEVSESRVVMGYSSKRSLCAFGEGLLSGAGEHYGERIEIARPMCVKRGDERCVFEVDIT
ncbi:MAG: heme NO-binding domain-containing protein [Solirubrobacterales bacterium]